MAGELKLAMREELPLGMKWKPRPHLGKYAQDMDQAMFNLAYPVTHPIDTLSGIGALVSGAASKLTPYDDPEAEQVLSGAGDYLSRYAPSNIGQTLTEHPFTSAVDLFPAAYGAGKLAKAGAKGMRPVSVRAPRAAMRSMVRQKATPRVPSGPIMKGVVPDSIERMYHGTSAAPFSKFDASKRNPEWIDWMEVPEAIWVSPNKGYANEYALTGRGAGPRRIYEVDVDTSGIFDPGKNPEHFNIVRDYRSRNPMPTHYYGGRSHAEKGYPDYHSELGLIDEIRSRGFPAARIADDDPYVPSTAVFDPRIIRTQGVEAWRPELDRWWWQSDPTY